MRIVLDTNVWISGILLPESTPGKIIEKWRSNSLTMTTSFPILEEIRRVLNYPKILKRIKWSEETITQYISYLEFFTEIISIDHIDSKVKADSKDSCILATLIASKADYLITGDEDLLELASSYSIITPNDFSMRFLF